MKKIRSLIDKYWDLLSYVFFGGLTTAVNFVVYLPLYNWAGLSGTLSNCVAWVVSVIFAFVTNKRFVFKSRDWSPAVALPELVKFVGCRLGSGLIETGVIFLTVDMLHWNGNLWKFIVSVLVVVINYSASKLLVFRKKNG